MRTKIFYYFFFALVIFSCSDDSSIGENTDTKNNARYYYKNSSIPDSVASELFDSATDCARRHDFYRDIYFLRKCDSIEPGNSTIFNGFGNHYGYLGNYDSSFYYFGRALRIDSSDIVTYINYGKWLNVKGDPDHALEILYLGAAHPTNNTRIFATLAKNITYSYELKKDYKQAIEVLSDSRTKIPLDTVISHELFEYENELRRIK